MNPIDIISKYYPAESDAYHILVTHSRSVADKALNLARDASGNESGHSVHRRSRYAA